MIYVRLIMVVPIFCILSMPGWLFAQAPTPSITDPTAPWMALMLQGGAFGLICYIVIFLFPRVTREAREEREARDKFMHLLIDKLQDHFNDRHRELVAGIREQTVAIVSATKENTERLEKAITCRYNGGK